MTRENWKVDDEGFLDYDLSELAEFRFKIKDAKFILKEPNGRAVTRYKNAQLKATKVVDGKTSGFNGLADADPFLLSMCCFRLVEEGGKVMQKPVSPETVQSWPNPIMEDLVKRCKRMGEIDLPDTKESLLEDKKRIEDKLRKMDDLGNGQKSTPDGSESAAKAEEDYDEYSEKPDTENT